MYTTKPLSLFKTTQEAARQLPQQGPSSGYLVMQDLTPDEEIKSFCFGIINFKDRRIRDLPFPQNKILTLEYSTDEENGFYFRETVLFVPVMNLPLAANRYYVVSAKGKHKGKVFTCSKREDMTACCFCSNWINDKEPSPFDYRDIYQQIEIIPHEGEFTAKAVASDGFVPYIFRQTFWTLHEKTPKNYQINEALGLNVTLRSHLPEIEIPISRNVGKWYCPFFFVKEKMSLKEQIERAMFYEVTLEQFYKQINGGVENKSVLFGEKEVIGQEEGLNDGFIWFTTRGNFNEERIGLSLVLWERVKWEENRGGWSEENREKDLEGKSGSFVLVERFLFKRMDGSLALALDFPHTNKIITK